MLHKQTAGQCAECNKKEIDQKKAKRRSTQHKSRVEAEHVGEISNHRESKLQHSLSPDKPNVDF